MLEKKRLFENVYVETKRKEDRVRKKAFVAISIAPKGELVRPMGFRGGS